jgi:hypothetical protein
VPLFPACRRLCSRVIPKVAGSAFSTLKRHSKYRQGQLAAWKGASSIQSPLPRALQARCSASLTRWSWSLLVDGHSRLFWGVLFVGWIRGGGCPRAQMAARRATRGCGSRTSQDDHMSSPGCPRATGSAHSKRSGPWQKLVTAVVKLVKPGVCAMPLPLPISRTMLGSWPSASRSCCRGWFGCQTFQGCG